MAQQVHSHLATLQARMLAPIPLPRPPARPQDANVFVSESDPEVDGKVGSTVAELTWALSQHLFSLVGQWVRTALFTLHTCLPAGQRP